MDASAPALATAPPLPGSAPVATPRRRARFHPLTVAEVRPLTPDSIEVTFTVPPELRAAYDYQPGQYVALRAVVEGLERRRSYSICRPPQRGSATLPGAISVGIKRDRGGIFSRWAHESLRPGDVVEVMSPEGLFTLRRDAQGVPLVAGRHIVGIAAGSGITPIMALAQTVLSAAHDARFTLIYANRTAQDVMFLEELSDLKDRDPARFALHHVLSREQRAAPVLSGRLDADRLDALLDTVVPTAQVDDWFLCGPIELVQLCRDTLASRGVSPDHVRFELFTAGTDRVGEPMPAAGAAGQVGEGGGGGASANDDVRHIRFTLDGQTASVDTPVGAGESILNAALRVRPDVPFACAGGVCGTCRARLVEGEVSMDANFALEPEELERGFVLTCQSHPRSATVVVDYDV